LAASNTAEWFPRTLLDELEEDELHRPVLFRLADDGDRRRLEELRSRVPDIVVRDRVLAQLAGLVQSRTPQERLTPSRIEAAVRAHLAGTPPDEYGVWVWYPWLRRLTHLLDRDAFVELRTARSQNKITREEGDRLAGKRVGIVGLSMGHAIALALATERGCGELRVADFDRLELSNLNRLPAGVHELGLRKVVVTSRAVAEIDPFIDVTCWPEGVRAATMDEFLLGGGRLDAVFDQCDSLDIKLLVRERARELGIPVLMATSDRGLIDVERFDLEPDRPLLHGLVGDLDSQRLRGLATMAEKLPAALAMMGGLDGVSPRMRESIAEVGSTIESWPQLASAVCLNAGVAADVCRRVLLGQLLSSGRHVVDLDELIVD